MSHTELSRREQLQQALEAFSRTPRFFLFKGVQVGRLMPEGCGPLGDLGDLTFAQLLDQVQSAGGLDLSITAEQEEGLFHLLQALGEDAGEPTQLAADDDISILVPDSFGTVDIPTLDEELKHQQTINEPEEPDDVPIGSVPLELALRSTLSKIASHEKYNAVRKRTIGEFWDPTWTSAPFEEAMSLEQFSGLDLAVLFKKRMVTDTRIQSILRALRRVLEFLESDLPSTPAPRRQRPPTFADQEQKPSARVPAKSPVADRTRTQETEPLSVAALAVWEILEQASGERILAHMMCERLSPTECAAAVLGETLSSATQRVLKSAVTEAVAERSLELVSALLRAPAVRLDHIVYALYGADTSPIAPLQIEAAAVARALGAVPASIGGHLCEGFWTLHPAALKVLANSSQGKSKGNGSRSRAALASVAGTYAQLDPFLQRWVKAHGKGQDSRRESRNRLKHRRRKGK